MLVLFDIDATLLKTNRAGVYAMHEAGKSLFHADFKLDGVEFGGSLDPLIMRELIKRNGHEPTPDALQRYRDAYAKNLRERLAHPGAGYALPGVFPILDRLEKTAGVTLGLLTGNFSDTGKAKMKTCGIDPERFRVQVFAEDSPHDPPARHHLPVVAMERYAEKIGRPIRGRDIVIIGDTPNDVHCALANDCWVIGVATGTFSHDVLDRRGAHLVVPTLEDTDLLVRWIVGRRSFV